jgi:transposase
LTGRAFDAGAAPRGKGGVLTKSGNGHARWLLNESAQHYRLPPKVSKYLSQRQQAIDKPYREEVKRISWKCQNRLHEKGRKLAARLKLRQKV